MTYEIRVGFEVYRELMIRRRTETTTFDEVIAEALGLTRNAASSVTTLNGTGFQFRGSWTPASSGNDILVKVLRLLAADDSNFLSGLAARANARARHRCYLARDPEALYHDRPDLTHHNLPVAQGWYVGTNISNHQKVQLLKDACETAGLVYGKDLLVSIDKDSPHNERDG